MSNDAKKITPIPSNNIEQIYCEMGPIEGPTYHKALASKVGLSYGTLFEDLMYSYITIFPDIRYVITTLSKFSTNFFKHHYKSLNTVSRYLCITEFIPNQ